jgi:C-terminal processing protease CtpA/Prc
MTTPGSSLPSAAAKPEASELPKWRVIDERFGLISLPALDTMGGGREATGPVYAAALRSGLQQMDAQPLCGWVIDLRKNGGGNMWPMLQGLDPLLGDAPFGFFIGQGGSSTPWIRTPSGIFPFAGAVPMSKSAYELRHSSAPLAVLIGPKTASSGEMVAIAFSARPGVKIFGQPSAGYATGNAVHPLSDGAFLVITEVTVKDRAFHAYRGPITPDEQVDPTQTEKTAVHWLAAQCSK